MTRCVFFFYTRGKYENENENENDSEKGLHAMYVPSFISSLNEIFHFT